MSASTRLGATTVAEVDALFVYRRNALSAVGHARAAMEQIARITDDPDFRDVEAADSLDAAAELIVRSLP